MVLNKVYRHLSVSLCVRDTIIRHCQLVQMVLGLRVDCILIRKNYRRKRLSDHSTVHPIDSLINGVA